MIFVFAAIKQSKAIRLIILGDDMVIRIQEMKPLSNLIETVLRNSIEVIVPSACFQECKGTKCWECIGSWLAFPGFIAGMVVL